MNRKALVGSVCGLAAVAAGAAVLPAHAAPGALQGPSSSQPPYVVRAVPGVVTKSLLTAGDSVGGYTMAGIPDGLGAYDNGDGTFTILMNHELGPTAGLVRSHGATGAFVSKWNVDKTTLAVNSGEDLIKKLLTWDAAGSSWVPATGTALQLARLCSADLPATEAFYDAASGLGTTERIFLNGEESGSEGRAVGTVVTGPDTGSAYVLPWLGKFSWENALAMPRTGTKTVVVGMNDTQGPSYVYIGEKKATGNDVERAGLTGGSLYAIKIDGVPSETDATTVPAGTRFSLLPMGDVSGLTGVQLDAAARGAGATIFNRGEDGAWDPTDDANFYLVTTASFQGISRLWKLRLDNPGDVLAGGVAEIEVASPPSPTQGPRMLDNITVNDRGQVLMQEDPGGQAYLAGIFMYDPATGGLARMAQHDPDRFLPGAPGFLTIDEESSGIIPAPFLGEGKYLIDVQSHRSVSIPGVVQDGQLLVMSVPPGWPVG